MTPHRTLTASILAAGLLMGTVGCAGAAQHGGTTLADVDAARAAWAAQDVSDYTYVLDAACGERALYGRFEVTVADGAVVAVEDDAGPVEPEAFLEWGGATISGVLDHVADGVEHVTAFAADPDTGVPERYEIDPLPDSIDDEECGTISGFVPGE